MFTFTFRINRSFLTYRSHPITIPKSQVDYGVIAAEGLTPDLLLVLPNGEKIDGQLYSGVAGYGPYYQIRTVTTTNGFGTLPIGEIYQIQVMRRDTRTYVTMSPAGRGD